MRLIFESIKFLETKTSMLFNLDFAYNTIIVILPSCLNHWLLFLIPAVVSQIFNPIAELLIPVGIPIKEAKIEIISR